MRIGEQPRQPFEVIHHRRSKNQSVRLNHRRIGGQQPSPVPADGTNECLIPQSRYPRLTLRRPQSDRRRNPIDRTRWCTSPSSRVASRTRLVCSTDRTGVHHQPVRCTSPNRRQDLPSGRVCITEPHGGIVVAGGVHHRTACGASPTGARASPNRSVYIAVVDRVHPRTASGTCQPEWCASPTSMVYIRIATCTFARRVPVTVVESVACNVHSGSATVRTPRMVTRGSTDCQSGPHARLVAGLRSPTRTRRDADPWARVGSSRDHER